MSKKHKLLSLILLSVSVLLLAACGSSKTPTPDANLMITQAAQTVAVQLTLNGALTPSATNTVQPSSTPAAPATATQAVQAPPPAAVTNTPQPPAAAPTSAQDNAAFVADVTVPDGTGATPGITFKKTWRIKNTGVSTWTEAYSLIWVDGEKMGFPDSGVKMPKAVNPGEEVEISADLTAPTKPGAYTSYFRLRNAGGQTFKMDGTGDLWVKINVGGASITPNLTGTAAVTPGTPAVTPTTPTP